MMSDPRSGPCLARKAHGPGPHLTPLAADASSGLVACRIGCLDLKLLCFCFDVCCCRNYFVLFEFFLFILRPTDYFNGTERTAKINGLDEMSSKVPTFCFCFGEVPVWQTGSEKLAALYLSVLASALCISLVSASCSPYFKSRKKKPTLCLRIMLYPIKKQVLVLWEKTIFWTT